MATTTDTVSFDSDERNRVKILSNPPRSPNRLMKSISQPFEQRNRVCSLSPLDRRAQSYPLLNTILVGHGEGLLVGRHLQVTGPTVVRLMEATDENAQMQSVTQRATHRHDGFIISPSTSSSGKQSSSNFSTHRSMKTMQFW